jgi:serine/threonine-protein phosphatase 5
MTVTPEDKERAVALKNEGNKAFAKHDWPTAIDFYTKAIELDDTQPTYYANRAQVGFVPYSSASSARLYFLLA